MSPRFLADYLCPIRTTMQWHRFRGGQVCEYRCFAVDLDGNQMIGGKSYQSEAEAYWTLRDFVEEECERRGIVT